MITIKLPAGKIDEIARVAVVKARDHKDGDQRAVGLDAQVTIAFNNEGYVWTGNLDGSDRSIRDVAKSLKRDNADGRIFDMRHI